MKEKKRKAKVIYLSKGQKTNKEQCMFCYTGFKPKKKVQLFCDKICRELYVETLEDQLLESKRKPKRVKRSELGKVKTEDATLKKIVREVKTDYPKLTFRLSVFSFVASVAFYLGVIRDLANKKDKQPARIQAATPNSSEVTKDSIPFILHP